MKTKSLSRITMCKNPPRTQRNIDLRDREYLTETEVNKILNATKRYSRNPIRDQALYSTR